MVFVWFSLGFPYIGVPPVFLVFCSGSARFSLFFSQAPPEVLYSFAMGFIHTTHLDVRHQRAASTFGRPRLQKARSGLLVETTHPTLEVDPTLQVNPGSTSSLGLVGPRAVRADRPRTVLADRPCGPSDRKRGLPVFGFSERGFASGGVFRNPTFTVDENSRRAGLPG